MSAEYTAILDEAFDLGGRDFAVIVHMRAQGGAQAAYRWHGDGEIPQPYRDALCRVARRMVDDRRLLLDFGVSPELLDPTQ